MLESAVRMMTSRWWTALGILMTVFAISRAARGPQLEIAKLFPGRLASDDLSAWVLEPNRDLGTSPLGPAALPRSRSSAGPSGGHVRSVANRNSNPLNIKLGSGTRRYLQVGLATISDILPNDGGRFLKFDSPETGFRAAVALLNTRGYHDLEVERALRRWSNNGYGAEILAGTSLDVQKPLPDLGRDDLKILLHAMVAAEGYRSATIADEIDRALRP
jgi:hypothetical protein